MTVARCVAVLDAPVIYRCNTPMLIECATITHVGTDAIRLKSRRGSSACARCARGEGCGGGVIGRLISRRQPVLSLHVDDAHAYQVGQAVELSLTPDKLVRLAAIMYLLPLAALFVGAGLGQWLAGSDAGAIGGAVAGCAGGAWMMSRWLASRGADLVPEVQPLERDQ